MLGRPAPAAEPGVRASVPVPRPGRSAAAALGSPNGSSPPLSIASSTSRNVALAWRSRTRPSSAARGTGRPARSVPTAMRRRTNACSYDAERPVVVVAGHRRSRSSSRHDAATVERDRGRRTLARDGGRASSTIPSSSCSACSAIRRRRCGGRRHCSPPTRRRAIARSPLWTIGMAHRELGELDAARAELDRAWVLAIELDDHDLAGQIAITLSLVVAYQGELGDALAILDVSEPRLTGAALGRLRIAARRHPLPAGRLRRRAGRVRRRARRCSARPATCSASCASAPTSAPCSAYLGRLDDARTHLERGGRSREPSSTRRCCGPSPSRTSPTSARSPATSRRPSSPSSGRRRTSAAAATRDRWPGRCASTTPGRCSRPTCSTRPRRWPTGRSSSRTRPRASSICAESLLVAAEAHLAAATTPAGDRRRPSAASTRSTTADAPGVGGAGHGRCCCGRGRRRPDGRARRRGGRRTPSTLEALGCRTESLRANLLAAELRVGLGDLDGADALLRWPPVTCASTVVHQPSALRVRALARGRPRQPGRRAAGGQPRRAPPRRPPGRARGHRAAGLRRRQQRRAWPASASGWPSRTAGRGELLAQLEATRRTTSLLPAARPPDDDMLADAAGPAPAASRPAARRGAGCRPAGRARRTSGSVLERRIRRPRPPGPGRGHPGGRPARRSRCALLGDRALARVRQPRRRPLRRVGGRQPGRRCTSSDRSTAWPRTSTAASTACTGSTGSRARRPRGRSRADTLDASPPRSPTGCSRRASRRSGRPVRDRADRGAARSAVGRPARPARPAGVGHAVADGLGDRPPARRQPVERVAARRRPRPAPRRRRGRRARRAAPRAAVLVGRRGHGRRGASPPSASRPRPHRLPRLVPAPTTRCSRRCGWPTARSPSSTSSGPRRCPARSCSRRATSPWGRRCSGGRCSGWPAR